MIELQELDVPLAAVDARMSAQVVVRRSRARAYLIATAAFCENDASTYSAVGLFCG